MKIVKWVTGLDDSLSHPKMLYPDMWDKLCEKYPDDCNRIFSETEQVVIDCIRKNGFKFGGSYHQCGKFGMPLFDDGTVFFVTMRHWVILCIRPGIPMEMIIGGIANTPGNTTCLIPAAKFQPQKRILSNNKKITR